MDYIDPCKTHPTNPMKICHVTIFLKLVFSYCDKKDCKDAVCSTPIPISICEGIRTRCNRCYKLPNLMKK